VEAALERSIVAAVRRYGKGRCHSCVGGNAGSDAKDSGCVLAFGTGCHVQAAPASQQHLSRLHLRRLCTLVDCCIGTDSELTQTPSPNTGQGQAALFLARSPQAMGVVPPSLRAARHPILAIQACERGQGQPVAIENKSAPSRVRAAGLTFSHGACFADLGAGPGSRQWPGIELAVRVTVALPPSRAAPPAFRAHDLRAALRARACRRRPDPAPAPARRVVRCGGEGPPINPSRAFDKNEVLRNSMAQYTLQRP
jgi:hypothetical protein